MPAYAPEDWPYVFERHLNAGELDAALALYEPNASFVSRSGDTVVGCAGIGRMLAEIIGMKAHMRCRVARVVTVGDIALLYNDWRATTVDAAGHPGEIHGKAIEIVRRQTDGSWKLIVGDPNGRG